MPEFSQSEQRLMSTQTYTENLVQLLEEFRKKQSHAFRAEKCRKIHSSYNCTMVKIHKNECQEIRRILRTLTLQMNRSTRKPTK